MPKLDLTPEPLAVAQEGLPARLTRLDVRIDNLAAIHPIREVTLSATASRQVVWCGKVATAEALSSAVIALEGDVSSRRELTGVAAAQNIFARAGEKGQTE